MSTNRGSYRAARRYRNGAYAAIGLGTLALVVAGQFGYGLVGLAVYVLGALVGFGLMAYVRLDDALSLGDERLCELERRASHYTVTLVGLVGWVSLVGASLLDATGVRELSAGETVLVYAYGAVFLVWGLVYAGLRLRR